MPLDIVAMFVFLWPNFRLILDLLVYLSVLTIDYVCIMNLLRWVLCPCSICLGFFFCLFLELFSFLTIITGVDEHSFFSRKIKSFH